MPGNSRGTTSVDHERKARLRAAVERAKVALQHSDDEEGAKAPEPAPAKADTPPSRLEQLEAAKEEARAKRRAEYERSHPGSPLPKDAVERYRALYPENGRSTPDEVIQGKLDAQMDGYDAVSADPDRYEQFLSRRALPAPAGETGVHREARKEYHDYASVREDEAKEREAYKAAYDNEVRGWQHVTGTKAEELLDARKARDEAIGEAAKTDRSPTEAGGERRGVAEVKEAAKRAIAKMAPYHNAALDVAGNPVTGSAAVGAAVEAGRVAAGQQSSLDRAREAAKAVLRKFGGK